ncbi:MAG: glycosyltransferase family 2 protein [Acidobacteriota bacterium]|jgi:dolichol-phosphate mannosyltransferase
MDKMSNTYYILQPRELPHLLSLVIPIYNEEEVLGLLLERIDKLMASMPCPVEVILVNDGSRDRSVVLLLEAARREPRYKVVSLARNFGHQVAATAGLEHARGDAVVLMDADLQDPPELILSMVEKYREGWDVVYARRIERQGETKFKQFTAWAFYRIMRKLIHKDLPVDVGDFRLMSRACLDVLLQMRELHRFLRGMVTWVGFAQTDVTFVRPPRAAGETKYPLSKMILFAWNAAVSFSPLPLRLSLGVGFFTAGFSLIYMAYAIYALLSGRMVAAGWASTITFIGLIGGGILISIGLLGEYVGRIFEEIKGRPLYTVNVTANLEPGNSRRNLSS